MRFFLFLFFVAAISVVCFGLDLKKVKEEAAKKKACQHDCGTAKYEPVCAGAPGQKPKSFGSECVLNNYNCENSNAPLSMVSKGQCPGSDGIRLS